MANATASPKARNQAARGSRPLKFINPSAVRKFCNGSSPNSLPAVATNGNTRGSFPVDDGHGPRRDSPVFMSFHGDIPPPGGVELYAGPRD